MKFRNLFLLVISQFFILGCSPSDDNSPFAGTWEEINSTPGDAAYWKIENNGQGFLCVEDEKSSTDTKIIEGNKLDDYDYGGGDILSLENGLIKRVGSDKGTQYEVYYKRTSTWPNWCN